MSEHEQNELWEKSLRSQLTPEEKGRLEAHLAERPDLRVQWEEEMAVFQAVREMPDAPVSSNFTSLVMQAVAAEARHAQRIEMAAHEGFFVWLRKHFAQLAVSMVVVTVAAVLALKVPHATSPLSDSSQEMAEQIKAMAAVTPVPPVDVLKDYEAIRRMSQTQVATGPDIELGALFAIAE
ncbi:MAG TPA: hypothetical protein VGH19_06340 [Verrucomicrobiae bacterium]